MSVDSSWTRYPKTRTAVRGDLEGRVTLMLQHGGWVAMVGSKSHHLDASVRLELDDVIQQIDLLFPPEGWIYEREPHSPDFVRWARPGWVCWRESDSSWRVGRPGKTADGLNEDLFNPTPATGKVFTTADRARHWAEVRLDRTNMNLRGPRPRAEQRAVKTLPDVRVTEDERQLAVALAERLGVSYSDLARAAVRFLDTATRDGSVVLERAGAQSTLKLHTRYV
jgi:hypothetical protein